MKIFFLPTDIRTLIFDIDSTLYTNPAYAYEQNDVQIQHWAKLTGRTVDAARAEIRTVQEGWSSAHNGKKISLGNTFAQLGVSISESITWRNTLLDPAQFLTRDERLIVTLTALAQHYALICVTNNPRCPAERTLDALGVREHIPEIIALDTCGVSKPAPEPFLLAASRTGVRPEHCVSIGDRYDIDLALPLELGMGAILIDTVHDVYSLPETLAVRNDKTATNSL